MGLIAGLRRLHRNPFDSITALTSVVLVVIVIIQMCAHNLFWAIASLGIQHALAMARSAVDAGRGDFRRRFLEFIWIWISLILDGLIIVFGIELSLVIGIPIFLILQFFFLQFVFDLTLND